MNERSLRMVQLHSSMQPRLSTWRHGACIRHHWHVGQCVNRRGVFGSQYICRSEIESRVSVRSKRTVSGWRRDIMFGGQRQSGSSPTIRETPYTATTTCAAKTIESSPGLSIMRWTGSDEQVQALNELREMMGGTEYASECTEEQLQWFLMDRKLDTEAAKEKLVGMLQWRRDFGADSITTTDVAQEAATGKAYLHVHNDVMDRPVIVVRASKHVKDAAPLVYSQQLCVYTLERALEKLPEGQDTVLGIFDLRGFQSQNADMGFVKFMVDIFFTYYPKRLGQVLFVDAPWIFKPGWEMMKPWLKKYAALVRFVSAEEVRREYFTNETVPEDFVPPSFLSRKDAQQ